MTKAIDPQRPSEWKKYHKGMCNGCKGGCCKLPVEVDIADLVRLDLLTKDEAEILSHKEILKKMQKAKIVESYQRKSDLFTLQQRANMDCIFLNEVTRLCTVYEKRPQTCRNFPEIGPRPGFCPHESK